MAAGRELEHIFQVIEHNFRSVRKRLYSPGICITIHITRHAKIRKYLINFYGVCELRMLVMYLLSMFITVTSVSVLISYWDQGLLLIIIVPIVSLTWDKPTRMKNY